MKRLLEFLFPDRRTSEIVSSFKYGMRVSRVQVALEQMDYDNNLLICQMAASNPVNWVYLRPPMTQEPMDPTIIKNAQRRDG